MLPVPVFQFMIVYRHSLQVNTNQQDPLTADLGRLHSSISYGTLSVCFLSLIKQRSSNFSEKNAILCGP